MKYHYGGAVIPGAYHYGTAAFSPREFYSVSGGAIRRRHLKRNAPERDAFDTILRAPYRKPSAPTPQFSSESFVPFAKMAMSKVLEKALVSEASTSIMVLPKAALPAVFEDDGIPDEVVMLALQ